MKVWVNGISVTYDGIELRFPRNIGTSYCSNIYWNDVNGFEPHTWRVIKHFLPRSSTFVDVGSNVGLYSVLAQKVNPRLMIQAYEPVPSIYAKNCLFHEENGLSIANVFNVAIGDEDGSGEMFLPINRSAIDEETTATLRRDSWQNAKLHEALLVTTKKLDSVLSERNGQTLIKIDVEDFEAGVLRGADEFLRRMKPTIVCEILPREHGNQETFDILKARGYVIFGISQCGLIRFAREDFIGHRAFTDFLLWPESSAPTLNYLAYEDLEASRV
jgi:FkbM family methyltransferase